MRRRRSSAGPGPRTRVTASCLGRRTCRWPFPRAWESAPGAAARRAPPAHCPPTRWSRLARNTAARPAPPRAPRPPPAAIPKNRWTPNSTTSSRPPRRLGGGEQPPEPPQPRSAMPLWQMGPQPKRPLWHRPWRRWRLPQPLPRTLAAAPQVAQHPARSKADSAPAGAAPGREPSPSKCNVFRVSNAVWWRGLSTSVLGCLLQTHSMHHDAGVSLVSESSMQNCSCVQVCLHLGLHLVSHQLFTVTIQEWVPWPGCTRAAAVSMFHHRREGRLKRDESGCVTRMHDFHFARIAKCVKWPTCSKRIAP